MRAVKIASIVVGSLVALVVLGLVAILVFVDPNDYRDRIASAVENSTGRKLELPGELGLSVFPWLALSVGEARLGEAPGFGTEPFVAIKEAKVGLRLLPLLKGELEVGSVRLVGLRVRLITDEQGRNNWDDLISKQDESQPDEPSGPTKLPTIAGLEIIDAAVLIEDRKANTRQELRKLDLTVSRFVSGEEVDIESAFELVASPEMQLAVKLDSQLTADLERNNFLLTKPTVAVTLAGAGYPKEGVPVNIQAQSIALDLATKRHTVEALDVKTTWKGEDPSAVGIPVALTVPQITADLERNNVAVTQPAVAVTLMGADYPKEGIAVNVQAASIALNLAAQRHTVQALDLATTWKGEGFPAAGVPVKLAIKEIGADLEAQTLQLPMIDMNLAGANITASLSGKQIMDAPQFAGRIDFKPVSLRDFAPKVGVTLPVTRAADTFKRFGFSGDVALTKTSADFKSFTLLLDDTTAKGSFGVADFDSKALRFDLNVDRLNADRYRPPEADEAQAASTKATESAPPADIPVDAIRDLNARGQLTVGEAVFAGMKFSKLRLGLDARNGNVRLNPAEAALYGGQYKGDVAIDATAAVPQVKMNQQVAGVNFAPLFQDFFESNRVSGIGNANVNVTAAGLTTDAMLKALNGTVDFNVNEGALEGSDLMYEIRRARAVVRQQPIPERVGPPRTPFSTLAGTGVITNGVLSNQDLDVATEFLRVKGAGKVDLIRDSLDYKLDVLVMKIPKEGADASQTAELVDARIPVTVTGSLTDPKVRPDIQGLLKEKAKEKIEEKKQEVEKKLREKLDERLKGILGGS